MFSFRTGLVKVISPCSSSLSANKIEKLHNIKITSHDRREIKIKPEPEHSVHNIFMHISKCKQELHFIAPLKKIKVY